MIFTPDEVKELEKSPDAICVLIDYHDQQGTMAEAADYLESSRFHDERRKELQAEKARLQRDTL